MKNLATTAKFAITKTTITRFSKKQRPNGFMEALSTSLVMPTSSI